MREHYTKAEPHIVARIEAASNDPFMFVNAIFDAGYDVSREGLRTPHLDRFESLKKENGAHTEASIIYRDGNFDAIERERLAFEYWKARRTWAESTSLDDDLAAKKQEHERRLAEKREREIEERARVILAEQNGREVEKARQKAAKELGYA